jgi:hypothetical protein
VWTDHSAVCLFNTLLRALGDALVCAVARFEVERCGPVVAFGEDVLATLHRRNANDALKSSAISHVVHVESLARSWPLAGSMVTLKEFLGLLDVQVDVRGARHLRLQ